MAVMRSPVTIMVWAAGSAAGVDVYDVAGADEGSGGGLSGANGGGGKEEPRK